MPDIGIFYIPVITDIPKTLPVWLEETMCKVTSNDSRQS